VVLEEKVNETVNRRLGNLEDQVDSVQEKLEKKIDKLDKSVVDCKLQINDKITEKFDYMIEIMKKNNST
jgi:uncharacterized coiled-coil protein SlyX